MNEIDFLKAVGKVDERYIYECMTYTPPNKKTVFFKRAGLIAAALAIMLSAVILFVRKAEPITVNENGFRIEKGVLVEYTGSDRLVVIPDGVMKIAENAFSDNPSADKIRFVRLGKDVEDMEADALAGLESLEDIEIDENNKNFIKSDGLVMSADGKILVRYERVGERSFTVPETVLKVAAYAVNGTGLEEIDFGENIEEIGSYAFSSNRYLKAIYLPDSVKTIGEGAFAGVPAIDGRVPDGAEIGRDAFDMVPFFNTLLAGEMCPAEEIERGLVSPKEAIFKSDIHILYQQIDYILAYLNGEGHDVDFSTLPEPQSYVCNAAADAYPAPDGAAIPQRVTADDLSFSDNGWGEIGIYDVQITIPCGEYKMIMEAYGDSLYKELYWRDAHFRIDRVYFLKDPSYIKERHTVTAFGWTASFEQEGDTYKNLVFTHEDGRTINPMGLRESISPYKLTFSPNETKVAVEYSYDHEGEIKNGIYVQSLNGEALTHGLYDFAEYLEYYYGRYKPGTLTWCGDGRIEGENDFGRFRWYTSEDPVIMNVGGAPGRQDEEHIQPTVLLGMNVSELASKFGELTYEYTEERTGYRVYSLSGMPSVHLAFLKEDGSDRPAENDFAAEILLSDGYPYSVAGISVGDEFANTRMERRSFEYNDGEKSVKIENRLDYYSVYAVVDVSGDKIPVYSASDEFENWWQSFCSNPKGKIVQIRVAANKG